MATTYEMIDAAIRMVEADVRHDLSAGTRCRLLSSFDNGNGALGKVRRTHVAVVSIEKVLPIWETAFPIDRSPQVAIEIANLVVAGKIDTSEAERQFGSLWSHCDALSFYHPDKQNGIMVGYGAAQAIRESFSHDHAAYPNAAEGATDIDIEPYDNDASYFAAVAYCDGPPWDTSSSATRRFEFWNWWLKVVLPTTMNIV